MASKTVHHYFICHFCFDKFSDHSSLVSHFPYCLIKTPTKRNDEGNRLPRLTKTDRELLHMLKLHRMTDKFVSPKPQDKYNVHLELPLSMNYISSSKQSSFDDAMCYTNTSLLTNNDQFEQETFSHTLTHRSSYHTYKYSRREQKNFYASVKRARWKKQQQQQSSRKSRPSTLIFHQKNFLIRLPTQIASRQRLNSNANNSYPLIFDPNFNSLVQVSSEPHFEHYFSAMNISFHLIHSIASQEFQLIVYSNDQQHHISHTAFSFLNILRRTMVDYSLDLQKTFKRNYFQTFGDHQHLTPMKVPRYDLSTSQTQMENNQQQLPRQTDTVRPTILISDRLPTTKNTTNATVRRSPVLTSIADRQSSINEVNTQPVVLLLDPIIEEPNLNRNSRPILLKKHKIEPETIIIETAPIRVLNGSVSPKKSPPSREKPSNPSPTKRDENSMMKSTRVHTRNTSIKTEPIAETYPTFESKPVIFSASDISRQWSTHQVFYRCHACSHEEFFVVLSRECMNLHLSSKHGNMEENFKQRLSTFITRKGRSMKIFQHFLKWQQPWSEKEIEQIFKLSNK